MNFYYTKFLKSTKKVFSEIQARQIGELPFINITGKDKTQKSDHDEIVKNVEAILVLYKEIKNHKLQIQIDQINERINHCEEKINELVYKLYGLSEEQKKSINNSYK